MTLILAGVYIAVSIGYGLLCAFAEANARQWNLVLGWPHARGRVLVAFMAGAALWPVVFVAEGWRWLRS